MLLHLLFSIVWNMDTFSIVVTLQLSISTFHVVNQLHEPFICNLLRGIIHSMKNLTSLEALAEHFFQFLFLSPTVILPTPYFTSTSGTILPLCGLGKSWSLFHWNNHILFFFFLFGTLMKKSLLYEKLVTSITNHATDEYKHETQTNTNVNSQMHTFQM
jgi:hypothetical protein